MSSCACVLSHVQPSATPWTIVHQVLLSVGFSRLEYWVAGPPPGGLRDPGVEPPSPVSPALAGRFFTTSAAWRDLLLGSGSSPSALEEEGRVTWVVSDLQGTLLPAELASSRGVRKRARGSVLRGFRPGVCLLSWEPGFPSCETQVQQVVWEVGLSVCPSSVGGSWQAQLSAPVS